MLAVLPIDENPDRIAALATVGDTATLRVELAEATSWYRFIGFDAALVRAIAEARTIIQDGSSWSGALDDDPELLLMECCPHPASDGWGYCEACGADRADFEADDSDQGFRVADDVDEDADGVT
jgi:hypothetical protein